MSSILHTFGRKLSSQVTSASKKSTVVIALSGGVDSSVAAAQLLRDYEHVEAIHMSNWNATSHDDTSTRACSSQADYEDAVATSRALDIPIHRHVLEREYWNDVFEPYIDDILKGRMGNPDIGCNRHIKFGALRQYCLQRYGSDSLFATGHYARLWHRQRDEHAPEDMELALDRDVTLADWLLSWGTGQHAVPPPILLAAVDTTKDQSYFLADCDADSFANVLFPLGDLYKKKPGTDDSEKNPSSPTVRQLAAVLNLPVATKRESMGICFVGKRPSGFRDFVQDYLPPPDRPVQFVDVETGSVVSTSQHEAHAALYTIGQGARLSGTSQKYFCVDRDVQNNQVWVCAGTHHPSLYTDSLILSSDLHWMARGEWPLPLQQEGCMRAQCRIRHLQPLVDCTIRVVNGSNRFQVEFDRPLRGITPGQMAVFHVANGLVCLGGGSILERGASYWERGLELPNELHPSGHNDQSVYRGSSEHLGREEQAEESEPVG